MFCCQLIDRSEFNIRLWEVGPVRAICTILLLDINISTKYIAPME